MQPLYRELAATGLKDIEVETTAEDTLFGNGQKLWDWLMRSNPIVDTVPGGLNLTDDGKT